MSESSRPNDPYSRVQYRRLVAWERRIAREGPFLRRVLESAPERSVVDFGAGTGEHVAFFAAEGARAVGLDRSASMLETAASHAAQGRGRFVEGDLREADVALAEEAAFGMGVCLGNVLPHLLTDEDLEAFVRAARAVLLPGGVLLVQVLNYARIRQQGLRHLPLNVRPGDEGAEEREIVFLRLLKPLDEHHLLFFPTTLTLDPENDEPVRLERSKRVVLRTWTAAECTAAFERGGFSVTLYGDMEGGAFDAGASSDLVVEARRCDAGPRTSP